MGDELLDFIQQKRTEVGWPSDRQMFARKGFGTFPEPAPDKGPRSEYAKHKVYQQFRAMIDAEFGTDQAQAVDQRGESEFDLEDVLQRGNATDEERDAIATGDVDVFDAVARRAIEAEAAG